MPSVDIFKWLKWWMYVSYFNIINNMNLVLFGWKSFENKSKRNIIPWNTQTNSNKNKFLHTQKIALLCCYNRLTCKQFTHYFIKTSDWRFPLLLFELKMLVLFPAMFSTILELSVNNISAYVMQSREISLRLDMWHFQFSI